MLALLVLVPVVAGAAVWAAPALTGGAGGRVPAAEGRMRAVVGVAAGLALGVTLAAAIAASWSQPVLALRWGAGLELRLEVAAVARVPVVLVPGIALPIVAYAAAHEPRAGLRRMVGLLVAFVGAMELVLVAGDLVSLLTGWELVGALSWGLIAHAWRTDAPAQAAHAFMATRAGDLGLFAAAGAAFAATGALTFPAPGAVDGAMAHLLVAGVVLAALAKSAQLPFSPWLFSAMAGPTPASALLHSATMVAAGAYLLARLHPVLDTVGWFAPVTIAVGLTTALAGGVVAALQRDAKRLLAASTSAQYGLMIVAVGAGWPAVAIAHLVAHALCKALLFLSAGAASSAAGSGALAAMGLGRRLRAMTWLTAAGTAALAAVPPLGAAWTKEQVVAAAAHLAPWLGVLVVVAGGLSAFYAARFQLLAYGPPRDRAQPVVARPGRTEHLAVGVLAVAGVLLGVVWLPPVAATAGRLAGGAVPPGAAWELAASLAAVAVGAYAALVLARRGRLAHLAATPRTRAAAAWLGLPTLTRRAIVVPTLVAAAAAARFDDVVVDGAVRAVARGARRAATGGRHADDRVVDAGVRGVAALATATARVLDAVAELGVDGAVTWLARLVGAAGRDSRRVQTGQTHTYYAVIAAGTVVLVAVTALWSR